MNEFWKLLERSEAGLKTWELLRNACHPAIVNHSVRVYLYAATLRDQSDTAVDDDVLLHSCLLHDVGASPLATGSERFEVQGADIAVRHLVEHHWTSDRCSEVWTAIALHTTPHIAERISATARLVRLAVRADFGAELIGSSLRRRTEADCPRLDIERILSGVVVEQALRDERRAPAATWPAALLAAHRASPADDARLAGF